MIKGGKVAGLDDGKIDPSDVVVEAIYASAARLGLDLKLAADLSRIADNLVRKRIGGGFVYYPVLARDARDRRIVEALEAGEKAEIIAAREGVSRATVYNVRRAILG